MKLEIIHVFNECVKQNFCIFRILFEKASGFSVQARSVLMNMLRNGGNIFYNPTYNMNMNIFRKCLFFLTIFLIYNSLFFSGMAFLEEFTLENPILLDRVVAVVNKEVITWSELYKVMEFEATEQVKNLGEEEKARIFKENEPLFLETLIDMRLQLQEARNLGIGISREEVDEAIENIKKKYSMSDEDFIASVKKEGFTMEEYKKRLAEQILINKVVQYQIRNKIVVSDAEVKKYIDANKDLLSGGEKYRLKQIFFKRPKNDEDIKSLEEKAGEVIHRLKAGENFSDLARIYSEDPSGKFGGDIGLIEQNQLAIEFANVLSKLKVGDYSMPFWTEKGLHIIKLEEKISAQSIDDLKEVVRKKLADTKFIESYKSWIKGLREKAFIEIRL
ncbi:MAG: peptidylprolyl isomerase [Thermodesulfovibrionales bacterium]